MGIIDIVLTFAFLFAVEAANHMAQRIQQRELEAEQVHEENRSASIYNAQPELCRKVDLLISISINCSLSKAAQTSSLCIRSQPNQKLHSSPQWKPSVIETVLKTQHN